MLRERVPLVEEEKVGLLDLDVEEVIAVWTEWTIQWSFTEEGNNTNGEEEDEREEGDVE